MSSRPVDWKLSPEARQLAIDIVRCPEVGLCHAAGGNRRKCHTVATWYKEQRGVRYVPEPWSGHITTAPVLFVSSNPGGEPKPGAPVEAKRWQTSAWKDDPLVKSFDSAFEPGQRPGIVDATHQQDALGNPPRRAVRYWSWAWYATRELLEGANPEPGRHYAMTEAVHCGTGGEAGVESALWVCAGQYLDRTLRVAGARVVVCVGRQARRAVGATLEIDLTAGGWGPGRLAGKRRVVLAVPHPSWSTWSLDDHVSKWLPAAKASLRP